MVRAAVAEVIGTFMLVFAGTAVAVAALLKNPTAGAPYDSTAIALAFGLILVAIVGALGHVSGAHVNPAVTLGLAATGKFPWGYVPAYVGAQLVGAVLGAVATWISFGNAARTTANLAATFPAPGVGDLRALTDCGMLTFKNEDLTAKIKEDLGVDTTGRDFLPFSDLEQSVRDDVEALRSSELIPDGIPITGAVYDVETGKLREVVRS